MLISNVDLEREVRVCKGPQILGNEFVSQKIE